MRCAAIFAAAGLLALGTVALGAEPTTAELQQQILALQARLNQLEAHQNTAADVDKTVNKIMADADSRSSFTISNFDKGGFVLRSEDGQFTLRPSVHFQIRYVANYRDSSTGQSSDTQSGFESRRTKFGFSGNVFGPDTTYQVIVAMSRNGGGASLEEGWLEHRFSDHLSIRGGIFKDPLAHESAVSAKRQMSADRSILTSYLVGGDNYVQGVMLEWNQDNWHIAAAFHDGMGDEKSNFEDWPTNDWNFGMAARSEYKVFGDWKDYSDYTTLSNKSDELLVFGFGGDWSQGGDFNQYTYTFDAQYKTGPWSAYLAYIGRLQDGNGGSWHEWGAMGQLSYLIDQVEPFIRYAYMQLDRDWSNPDDSIHELTLGANYYIHGHNMKFTVDVVYLPNGTPGSNGLDYLPAGNSEFVLRGQFQLYI